jgi:colicin import membrane protein
MMRQEPSHKNHAFFYYSLLLHFLLFTGLIVSFDWKHPMPVVKNSEQIIDARIWEEPKKPTKIIQEPVKIAPPPKVEPVQTPPKLPPKVIEPIVKKEAVIIPDPKIKKQKEDLIQKQLLADMQKQKVTEKKKQKQKAVEDALQKEMQALNEKKLLDAMLKEQKQIAEATAAKMRGIVDKYKALILQAISQNWLIPGGVNKKLSAELIIRLAPGGVVLDVHVTKSSGDVALDRSATAAVYKASPLPVPTNSAEFEAFRQFVLKVKPESILASSS